MRRAPVLLVLASLTLAACGGSSSDNAASGAARSTASVAHGASSSTITGTASGASKSTTSKAAAPKSSATKSAGQGQSITEVLRACLRQHVKHCALPGGGPTVAHVHVASPPAAPVKSPAVKTPPAGQSPPAVARGKTGAPLGSPTGSEPGGTPGKEAFERFAACLHANGVSVQSASGARASTSEQAKAADAKCLVYLDGGA
jgi:hypothetical protein